MGADKYWVFVTFSNSLCFIQQVAAGSYVAHTHFVCSSHASHEAPLVPVLWHAAASPLSFPHPGMSERSCRAISVEPRCATEIHSLFEIYQKYPVEGDRPHINISTIGGEIGGGNAFNRIPFLSYKNEENTLLGTICQNGPLVSATLIQQAPLASRRLLEATTDTS